MSFAAVEGAARVTSVNKHWMTDTMLEGSLPRAK